jgi:Fe-S-cluster containining protein
MKLDVLKSPAEPWFADGLRFTCSQCGNCCSGPPGFVWISREEIARVAKHLGMSGPDVAEKYCRKVGGRFCLKERRDPRHGGYDCIFIKELPAEQAKSGKVAHARRICSIYPVRPLQCRTWPFWTGNLASRAAWESASKRCPGMNQGELFDSARIEKLRDAEDWPRDPPTSQRVPTE